MARALHEIENDIRALSPEDKGQLFRDLVAEIDGEPEKDVEAAWLQEAHRRYQELRNGSVKPIPADEVIKNARARLKK